MSKPKRKPKKPKVDRDLAAYMSVLTPDEQAMEVIKRLNTEIAKMVAHGVSTDAILMALYGYTFNQLRSRYGDEAVAGMMEDNADKIRRGEIDNGG